MDSCKDFHESLSSIPILYAPPEPTSSLLNTNVAPTAMESAQIESLMAAASTTVDLLNTRLEHAQMHLKAYETAKNVCLDYIAEHRRLLSTVNRVPSEIWNEIFQWRQMDHIQTEHAHHGTFTSTPLHIPQIQTYGSVSSLWRHVTINSPFLWSAIEWTTYDLPPKACDLLELWLLRSKHHPLSVTIKGRFSSDGPPPSRFLQGINILLSHGRRWQNFHLDMDSLHFRTLMVHWPHALKNAPLLETCYIKVGKWARPIVLNAPRLSEVHLDFSSQDSNAPPLVPWRNIVKLTLGNRTTTYFSTSEPRSQVDHLKLCPSLNELVLHNYMNNQIDRANDVPPLMHSTLKSLSIVGGRPVVLTRLTLPSLTSLKLSCQDGQDDRQIVEDFILRSPNLRHLCLAKRYSIIEHPRLNHDGKLKRLSLVGCYRDAAFMARALYVLRDSKVFPEIATLVINIEIPTFTVEPTDTDTERHSQDAFARLANRIRYLCKSRLRGPNDMSRSLHNIMVLAVKKPGAAALESESLLRLETMAKDIEGLDVKVDVNLPLLLD